MRLITRWIFSLSLVGPVVPLSPSVAQTPSPEERVVQEALTAIDYCFHWAGEGGDQSEERNKEINEGLNQDCPVAKAKAQQAYQLYPQNAALAAGLLALIDIDYFDVTEAEKTRLCQTAAPRFRGAFRTSQTEDVLFRSTCPAQAATVYGH